MKTQHSMVLTNRAFFLTTSTFFLSALVNTLGNMILSHPHPGQCRNGHGTCRLQCAGTAQLCHQRVVSRHRAGTGSSDLRLLCG